MAYQAGASLGQFWDAMLKLRGQRLEEQEFEARMRQQRQEQMMQIAQQASSAIGSSLLSFAQNQKTDRIWNQIGNETLGPPRAHAVDPIADAIGEVAKDRTPGFFTGGKEEMLARMMLSKQLNANLATQSLAQQRKIATAQRMMQMTSEPFQKGFNNIKGYNAQIDTLNDSINSAITNGNRALYDTSSQAMTSLYQALKLTHPSTTIPPPVIPPFVSPEQQKAIMDAQTDIGTQQGILGQMQADVNKTPFGLSGGGIPGAIGSFFGITGPSPNVVQGRQEAITAQQQNISDLEKAMKALPGAQEYFSATPQARAAGARIGGATTGNRTGQIVNGYPLGDKRINPSTHEIVIWDGNSWVKQQ